MSTPLGAFLLPGGHANCFQAFYFASTEKSRLVRGNLTSEMVMQTSYN